MKRLFDIVVSACAMRVLALPLLVVMGMVREGISAAGEATMGKFTGLGADTRAGS